MWLLSFAFITVLSVNTVNTSKCLCDDVNYVVMCSRLNLSEFRETDVCCEHFLKIDFSENAFREYPKALRIFRTVNLSRNSVEYLDSAEPQAVNVLDLSQNILKKIDFADTFLSLHQLNAPGNFLGDTNDEFLKGHCNLTHLDLSKNKIKSLHSITKCAQLSILVAQHNLISILPDNFAMLKKLKMLDTSHNKLLFVSNLPRSLAGLDLSSNELGIVEYTTFRGLSSLTDLDLSENKVSSIEKEAWANLSSLENLYLERNKLTVITNESFLGLKNLKYLELSDNYIESIPADTFSNLLNLQKLRLNGNSLKLLPALRIGVNVSSISFSVNLIKSMNLSAILALFSGTTSQRVITVFLNPLSAYDPEWPKIMRHFDWECLSYSHAKLIEMLLQVISIFPRQRSYEMATTHCSSIRFFKGNHFLGLSVRDAAEIGYPWHIVALKKALQIDSDDSNHSDDSKLIHEEHYINVKNNAIVCGPLLIQVIVIFYIYNLLKLF